MAGLLSTHPFGRRRVSRFQRFLVHMEMRFAI
ncbi:unnamed protein product [Lathyrus oleraceus]